MTVGLVALTALTVYTRCYRRQDKIHNVKHVYSPAIVIKITILAWS